MTDKYFVRCGEEGFQTYPTEVEAKEEAQRRLDNERETAEEDGWYENVEDIVWGKICQVTKPIELPSSNKSEQLFDYQFFNVEDVT